MGKNGVVILPIVLICLLLSFFISADAHPCTSSAGQADNGHELQQFAAGGHVLGFTPDGIYVASSSHALKVDFVNAAMVQPVAESAGNSQNTVSPLSRVTYNGAWKGVNIVYSASAQGIAESTYYLNTPASADIIRLRYNRPVSLDGRGDLVISFENGNMVESAPIAWQEVDGQRTAVQAKYAICGDNEISFALSDYRPGVPVVIDPTLAWNTFLGGGGSDRGNAIAIDSNGNIYMAGSSTDTWGAPVRAFLGGQEAFAAKLDRNGSLIWNTFLGSGGYDVAGAIALDADGNVYIAGTSRGTWGTPVRAYTAGPQDAFAAELDNNGNLIWNTFLGGSGDDMGAGIKVDAARNVYVSGTSFLTWGGPLRQFSGAEDVFAARLDGNGNLIWNTFLGGSNHVWVGEIAIDSAGNIYLAGGSDTSWGNPVRAYSNGYDAFAAKLDNNGGLVWNTFLGGSGDDEGATIAVDAGGNVYATGNSGATWGSPVRAFSGSTDVFAAKLDNNGNLKWNTFLGGSGVDFGLGIAVDAAGNVYAAGTSNATWGNPVLAYMGGQDAFAAGLDNNGSLIWNTFLGGGSNDLGLGIAADACGNLYVTGASNSTWGTPVRPYAGGQNAFVAGISNPHDPSVTSFAPTSGGSGTDVVIIGTNLLGTTAISFGDTPAASFKVNSSTRITAKVGTGMTGIITVRTACGRAASRDNFNFLYPVTIDRGPSMPATPQGPVPLPGILVQSAALSALKVSPGAPVTVTAQATNTGAANGSTRLTLYVNGQEESSQGVTVASGSSVPVAFTVTRNEPGTYTVYVGGTQAGSFTVDQFSDTNTILYISGALILFAFAIGVIYTTRRKRTGR